MVALAAGLARVGSGSPPSAGRVGIVDPDTGVPPRCSTSARRSTHSLRRGPTAAPTSSPPRRSTASAPAGAAGPTFGLAHGVRHRRRRASPASSSQGSGTTPTLLPDGLVAITDNADPRMHVVVLDRADGARGLPGGVFEDASAAERSLVSVGRGVIVANIAGYGGPLGTAPRPTADGGLARVDVVGRRLLGGLDLRRGRAASVLVALSQGTGLLYAVTKPHSWWGVNAWYLTGLDARTGRAAFSVRTGRGNRVAVTPGGHALGPDGGAYLAARAGIVRVHDRTPVRGS